LGPADWLAAAAAAAATAHRDAARVAGRLCKSTGPELRQRQRGQAKAAQLRQDWLVLASRAAAGDQLLAAAFMPALCHFSWCVGCHAKYCRPLVLLNKVDRAGATPQRCGEVESGLWNYEGSCCPHSACCCIPLTARGRLPRLTIGGCCHCSSMHANEVAAASITSRPLAAAFDVFAALGATDDQLDFPVLYASARQVPFVRRQAGCNGAAWPDAVSSIGGACFFWAKRWLGCRSLEQLPSKECHNLRLLFKDSIMLVCRAGPASACRPWASRQMAPQWHRCWMP
jgi:hypothetical protein